MGASFVGSKAFSGPSSLKVPANEKATYPITFTPTWGCDEKCKLTLRNSKSGDSFEYELHGTADEPLAEGHEVIKCNARDTVTHVFKVINPTNKPVAYNVESDIPFVSGEPTIAVPGGQTKEYTMKLSPQLGGQYTGSVNFTHPTTGEFSWYTVEVSVDSPLEEQVLDIAAVVRQAVSVEISLANPLPEPIEFEVLLTGEGLLGDSTFTLAPLAVGTYELYYSPLVAKGHSGSIAFLNDRVGEFWYRLKLKASPASPVQLEPLACAVGAKATCPITIENPLGKEISLQAHVTNRTNFVVDPPSVTLPPYGDATVLVEYVPSSIGEDEHTQITLTNPNLGDWQYLATGRGEPPAVMPEHCPVATVAEASSYMFSFRNPFPMPLVLDVTLRNTKVDATSAAAAVPELATAGSSRGSRRGSSRGSERSRKSEPVEPAEPDAFTLLLRKTSGVVLSPFTSMSVPLSFAPVSIAEKHATVEVKAPYRDGTLTWQFPIRGVVNAPPHLHALAFSCPAKKAIRQVIELPLRALAGLTGPEAFAFELAVPSSAKALVDRALTITPVETTISRVDQPLKFQVLFEPLRPFTTTVTLVVLRSTGGRWPFEMQLDATDPEPDDTFSIEANLNSTTTVKFSLTNRFQAYAPFQAYFSTDSAYTLDVAPSNGLLAPAGSDGTQFSVSFSPTEYGKLERGRLIIQTAEMQWTYEVVGTHPQFQLPTNVVSKVDSHLRSTYAAQLGQKTGKNAVKKNMSQNELAKGRDRLGVGASAVP